MNPFEEQAQKWSSGGDERSCLLVVLFLEDADTVAVRKGVLAEEKSALWGLDAPTRMGLKALDALVRALQPSPKVAHVEVIVFDDASLSARKQASFGTYVMDEADWREVNDFYTDRRWRAVPVFCDCSSEWVRQQIEAEEKAPYSLLQYATSLAATRRFAGIWNSMAQRSPSHCATLSARILLRCHPFALRCSANREPATFNPSSLYNALRPPATSESESAAKVRAATSRFAPAAPQSIEMLPVDRLASIDGLDVRSQIAILSADVVRAGERESESVRRMTESRLACAMLRVLFARERAMSRV